MESMELNFPHDMQKATLPEETIELRNIRNLASKLYAEISQGGVEAIKKLFSKGSTLSEQVHFDRSEEYLKQIIISQCDIDKMLLAHKYYDTLFYRTLEFRQESKKIRKKLSDDDLYFDSDIINLLFGNSLLITSKDEYEQLKKLIYGDVNDRNKLYDILLEERFKIQYEKETNPIIKFFQSFNYQRLKKTNLLENSFLQKIRNAMKENAYVDSDNIILALSETHKMLEKEIREYESIKDIEDIAKMTLATLIEKPTGILNIEEEAKRLRNEMKNNGYSDRIDTEYRGEQVSLHYKTGISQIFENEKVSFDKVPDAMKALQKEYEKAYCDSKQSDEEYIKRIVKIFADFISLQPYEDGDKSTGLYLFNRMLLSKGIIPPPISVVNDSEIIKAFYTVQDKKDYTILQELVIKKYKKMHENLGESIPRKEQDKGEKEEQL